MKLSDFDYDLPKNLIAQKPASPRDRSRLLILERKSGKIGHRYFYDLPDYLRAGDLLVLNDTKVMRARLAGRRAETGGRVEVFLLKKMKGGNWQCLVGGPSRKENLEIHFERGLKAKIISKKDDGTWLVRFNLTGAKFLRLVEKIGQVPLPPYIKKSSVKDKDSYQTVYANEKKTGSVAAPTAGLHFTPALLKRLEKMGIETAFVTLRVGLGTFAPVKTGRIEDHKMHQEYYQVSKAAAKKIIRVKKEGRRVIAVGTTSARALESAIDKKMLRVARYAPRDLSGWTGIFIRPGYKFKVADALITNFHLPKSTLLMLVAAFAGQGEKSKRSGLKKIKRAYREAVEGKYRFFSYGDAMLIV